MGSEVGRPLNPFGWVGNHVKERAVQLSAAVQGLLDERKRSQHFSRIYERHQKMDDRVKQFARVLLDEKKRTAQLSAAHEFGIKTHKKMDRTIQFWTRTIAIYASYKVCFRFFLQPCCIYRAFAFTLK